MESLTQVAPLVLRGVGWRRLNGTGAIAPRRLARGERLDMALSAAGSYERVQRVYAAMKLPTKAAP